MSALLITSFPGKALRMFVDIARLAEIKRILGECHLISSLPGKALRTLVDIARLERADLLALVCGVLL